MTTRPPPRQIDGAAADAGVHVFAPGVTLFSGENGAGKTNVIEAIAVVSGRPSFRNAEPREMAREGSFFVRAAGRRESGKDEGMDTYDLASEERDREINFILSDRERTKIKQIDDALERLEDNTYGECESCGLEIAAERLEAMPFTRLCRDCQQDQEREARTQRRSEEERNTYRKFGSTDADEEDA